MKKTITFDRELSEEILGIFDKKVVDGIIVGQDGKPVLSAEGKEVRIEEFAGLTADSEIIKSDLTSLIEFSKKHSTTLS